MRTNVVLDDELVQRAFAVSHARTKKELLHLALTELIRTRSKKDLSELAGKVLLEPGYDYKRLRRTRGGHR